MYKFNNYTGYFWIKIALSIAIFLFFIMLIIDLSTSYLVKDQVYDDIDSVPYRQSALVLGTSKYYMNNTHNQYYQHRISTAKKLFEANKVSYILLSGDNSTPYYNEPKMMKKDLLSLNISSDSLLQDFAGYHTLDSVIRADKVFNLQPFTIISQRFHCERALFIAKYRKIDAICFVAPDPGIHFKVRIREFFARTLMFIYCVIGREPNSLDVIAEK